MQRPFLLFLAALISGIITGNYLPSLQTSSLMICFLPLLIFLLLGLLHKKSPNHLECYGYPVHSGKPGHEPS